MSFGASVDRAAELLSECAGSTLLFVGENLTAFSHLCVAEWVSQQIAPHIITQSTDGLWQLDYIQLDLIFVKSTI